MELCSLNMDVIFRAEQKRRAERGGDDPFVMARRSRSKMKRKADFYDKKRRRTMPLEA
jgi:hypothetical protein